MSGAPKKLHEEGSHSTTPVKRHLDESSLYSSPSGKLIQPGSSDFHGSSAHDGRSAKIQRVESHDDKRPSLAHWKPAGSSNFVDHSTSSDIRSEAKQNKDRGAEKWDRERKDSQKEKETDGREKDSAKKESFVAVDKENLILEKTASDVAVKPAEHENTAAEMKTLKDDTLKPHDRDPKDKKREKDVDTGDRHDQSSKYNDKKSDDTEKDKDTFESIQGRKMSQLRGGSQVSQQEPRFRSRMCDGEGSPGKSEVSPIVYKAGECVQELLKSWKAFEAIPDAKIAENQQNGPTLEIRIPAKFVTSTNRQVKGVQLWGTDIYTNDSDLVAVLMHTGYCSPTSSPPPSAIQELRASVRVLPPQDSYTSTLRNNVRSRAWGAGIGCSFRIEHCCIVKKGGGTIDLEPRLRHTSAVEPTLAPAAVERTITTRAAASNALRQQRFVREVTIGFNLCNEPWLKYSISIVADKGFKKSLYTSARLKKGEVIYLETHFNSSHRYELCFSGEKPRSVGPNSNASDIEPEKHQSSSHHHSQNRDTGEHELRDVFRWSRCKKAMPEIVMRSIGIPLPAEQVEVVQDNLEWEEVQWSQTSVWVSGKEYPLARVHFLSPN